MKKANLNTGFTLLITLLVLFVTNFTFAQKDFSENSTRIANDFTEYQVLQQSQLTEMPEAGFNTFTGGDAYLNKELQEIRDSIGNSQWWDNLSIEARSEIGQKIQSLPTDFSVNDLKVIMAVSWEDHLANRDAESSVVRVSCPIGDVFLYNQDDVDAFGAMGCTEVTGHLIIDDGCCSPKIIDLTPLINLTTVGSILEIRASQLTSLDGLSNLTSVGYLRLINNDALVSLGGLSGLVECNGPITDPCGCSSFQNRIDNNSSLVDLTGLSSLTSVASGLFINANSSLENVDGLNNLSYVGGALAIENHPVLEEIFSLSSLTTVVRDLVFRGNAVLKNFNGLQNVTSVGIWVVVDNNAMLKNFEGMSGLSSIGGRLWVINNPELKNMEGLSSLSSLDGDVWIENNAAIKNLEGLSSLSSAGGVIVFHNPSIKNLDGILGISSVNGSVNIWDNASIKNVDGLSNLTSVGDWMVLQELPALVNIDGLSNLSWAGNLMGLATCPLITNVDALSNLTIVYGLLGVIDMAGVQNVDGLSNVTSAGELWLFLNPSLTSCCGIYQLLCADPPACTTNAVGGAIDIFGNGAGCTEAEIIAGDPCSPPALSTPQNGINMEANYGHIPDFSVYPNPADEQITIGLEQFTFGSAQVKIMNSLGQTVWQKQINDVSQTNQLTVNLSDYSFFQPGLYFVTVFHGGDVYTETVIQQ